MRLQRQVNNKGSFLSGVSIAKSIGLHWCQRGSHTLLKMVSPVFDLKCLKLALAVYVRQHLFSMCLTCCVQYREIGMAFPDALLNST